MHVFKLEICIFTNTLCSVATNDLSLRLAAEMPCEWEEAETRGGRLVVEWCLDSRNRWTDRFHLLQGICGICSGSVYIAIL